MSSRVLARVMVRMVYDPGFAARVLADPRGALAGLPLGEREWAWLRRTDLRAWRSDPDVPARSVDALLQQFPAGTALALGSGLGPDPFGAFFASPRFHAAVQDRGSLALAFADHLLERVEAGEVGDRRVVPVAVLEREIVELHRQAWARTVGPESGEDRLRLSPDRRLHRTAAGTAELHQTLREALEAAGPDLPRAVLDRTVPLPATTIDPGTPQRLLLELVRDDGPRVRFPVAVLEIAAPFHDLLAFAGSPRSVGDLAAEAERLGIEPGEALETIETLVEEGTLVG